MVRYIDPTMKVHAAFSRDSKISLETSFQEVVHLVQTEEAEVAKLQCSTETPDEQSQECTSDAERSRGRWCAV